MSRSALRSVLELRTPFTRLPPTFLLPLPQRALFNTTAQHVEPSTSIFEDAATILTPGTSTPPPKQEAIWAKATAKAVRTIPTTHRFPPTAPTPQPERTGPADASVTDLLPVLAAQPGGHYVTVHIHGKPYLVTQGDAIRLPFRMPGVLAGDVLRLNRASALGSRDLTVKGAPYIDEKLFECRAVVIGENQEPERLKIKKKRRCRKTKTVVSQHSYTVLRVSEVKIVAE